MKESVIREARELGLDVEVQRLEESTRTVGDAARAVGCQEAEIAKSIVFIADGEPVVCIASGEHRIDPDKVADAMDAAEVRQASASEVRAATGYAIGGVPPIGHGLPVIFDEALLRHQRIWAAAGDDHSLFCIGPRELADRVRATVTPVA
ncbi:MAG TPA: YbaK/EbsC family protein [Thermoleophilaceae bacterium]|nr:YbaK/EbsC family protein [Thermoleophilaceae bacterium]